jgi:hypothetical protein
MNAVSARLAAASGIFFFVALFVGNGLALAGVPEVTDAASALARLQHDPGPLNRIGLSLEILAFPAFLVFLGYVYRVLRRAEGPDGWASGVALGGGLLYVAIKFGSITPVMVGFTRQDELSPELARTLIDLNDMAFVTSGLLLGVFCLAAAGSCLAYRMQPRWLGWSGVVVGALTVAFGVVGIVAVDSWSPLPFLGSGLWTLGFSIMLTVRGPRSGQHGPSGTTPATSDAVGVV